MTPTSVRAKQATQLATPITPTSNAAKDNVQNLRASRPDLGILMAMLEVDVITLTECLVSRGSCHFLHRRRQEFTTTSKESAKCASELGQRFL